MKLWSCNHIVSSVEITFNWLAEIPSQQGFNKAWQPHFDIDYDLLYDKRKKYTVKHVYDLYAQFTSQLGALLVRKPQATRCNTAQIWQIL